MGRRQFLTHCLGLSARTMTGARLCVLGSALVGRVSATSALDRTGTRSTESKEEPSARSAPGTMPRARCAVMRAFGGRRGPGGRYTRSPRIRNTSGSSYWTRSAERPSRLLLHDLTQSAPAAPIRFFERFCFMIHTSLIATSQPPSASARKESARCGAAEAILLHMEGSLVSCGSARPLTITGAGRPRRRAGTRRGQAHRADGNTERLVKLKRSSALRKEPVR